MVNCFRFSNFWQSFLILILFFIAPFWGAVVALYVIYKSRKRDDVFFALFTVASFWGVLAFTQKSISLDIETDIERYYGMIESLSIHRLSDLYTILPECSYMFVFMPICILIHFLTGNVQYISYFWVTLSYLFLFLLIKKVLINEGLYSGKTFVKLLLISMFSLMLFVQISETIKNAVAFAIFFYLASIIYYQGYSIKRILLFIIPIGIHPSVLFLFPLFLYKWVNTKILLVSSFILFVFGMSINIMELLTRIIPNSGYFLILLSIADGYSTDTDSSSIRYILLSFLSYIIALYLYKIGGKKTNSITNIVLLYFFMSCLNMHNLTSYVRFVNFMHTIFVFLLLALLKLKRSLKGRTTAINFAFYSVVLINFVMTIRLTVGRTQIGSYASSYMNNSFVDIIFSSLYTYLHTGPKF